MRNTQQIRSVWHPPCVAKGTVFLEAYRALDIVMQKWGYRPRSGVTGAYNCRRITGGSNWSLHAYGPGARYVFWTGVAVTTANAVDINWDKNPYGRNLVTDMPRGMVDEILSIKTVDGLQVFRWGGYFTNNKDAMHFAIVVSPAELARGVVIPGQPEQKKEDVMDPEQEKRVIDRLTALAEDVVEIRAVLSEADTGLVRRVDDLHGGLFDPKRGLQALIIAQRKVLARIVDLVTEVESGERDAREVVREISETLRRGLGEG